MTRSLRARYPKHKLNTRRTDFHVRCPLTRGNKNLNFHSWGDGAIGWNDATPRQILSLEQKWLFLDDRSLASGQPQKQQQVGPYCSTCEAQHQVHRCNSRLENGGNKLHDWRYHMLIFHPAGRYCIDMMIIKHHKT